MNAWVPANLMVKVTLGWTSIPSMEKQEYPKSLKATETGDRSQPPDN